MPEEMPTSQKSLNTEEFKVLEARSARKELLEKEIASSGRILEARNEALRQAVIDGDFSKAYGATEKLRARVEKLENDFKEAWGALGEDTEDPTNAHNRYVDDANKGKQ